MTHFNTFTPKEDLEGAGFIPGLCPDPLFPENSVHVGPDENGVFWITCKIPAGTSPGEYTLKVKLTLENSFSYVDWGQLEVFAAGGVFSYSEQFAFSPDRPSAVSFIADGPVKLCSMEFHELGRIWD